ncbi:unnamed protein product [Notodromas monacha]|uniref:26S proteasome non-ATPase regulatory subunit 8 n=1 Tax=Notodromas monacha TaxID=399045 RepID=A0A7R9BUB3_9CRUS|nr:unnamed protein product [Notodromas monacha]CAG0920830.1 unnamed protein product [Notodromas monacha]
MSLNTDVEALYQQLNENWSKSPPNLPKCGETLKKLKIALTQLSFLPTKKTLSPISKKELLLARNVLEIGAQWSITERNLPSFERFMAQLKCYYYDYKNELPPSALMNEMLGLNLLFLLSQNRLAEFHSEVELLPRDESQNNIYLKHPISLEQYLMEGSYNKVFLAKGYVPAPSYNFFMDILLDTVRGEMASCMQKAYYQITFAEAQRMLNIKDDDAMKKFAKQLNWTTKKGTHFFDFSNVHKVDECGTGPLPAHELAKMAIEYAKELEMIV